MGSQIDLLVYFVVLLIVTHSQFASGVITASNDTCDIRYQIRTKYHTVKNCSAQSIPGCDAVYKIAYSSFPPYVFKENGTVKGILLEYIDEIIHSCCHGCGKFEFIGPLEGKEIFYVNASIILPVRTAKTNDHYLGDEFYYLAEMPGVTFMKEKELLSPQEFSSKMLWAVADTWPLFTIAFVMSLTSGVVMWILDMTSNPEHFPRSFPKGVFEGFWWAFISMTTVGYGDRAPKFFLAKLFAMIWIFIGITIFAMYSATLTSALADAVATKQETVLGKNVAVLNSTTEGRLAALKESAIVVEFKSIADIIHALHERTVEAVALDDHLMSYYMVDMINKVPDLHFLKHTTIEGQAYGVAIPPEKHDISILIESFFSHNEDQRDLILSVIMAHYQKVDHSTHVEEHMQIFSLDSPIFKYALYGSAALIGAGSILGIIMISISYRSKQNKDVEEMIEKAHHKGKLDNITFDDIDSRFAEEARYMFSKWRNQIENNGRIGKTNYSMEANE